MTAQILFLNVLIFIDSRVRDFRVFFFFFVGLGFELRAYTLSHPTNPFFIIRSQLNYLSGLASIYLISAA
jgi:hypothetical protein